MSETLRGVFLTYTVRADLRQKAWSATSPEGPPPLPSPFLLLPSLLSPPFPSLPLRSRTPLIQLGGLAERCKLPQRGLGRSPSQNRIWCILALNYDIWWHVMWQQLLHLFDVFDGAPPRRFGCASTTWISPVNCCL